MEQAGAHCQTSSPLLSQCMHEPLNETETSDVPDGLVGVPCDSEAWLDGIKCNCIIDSGSQVTIISWSFYSRYLSHRQLFSTKKVLDIEGAAGQKVPYLGYVEVDMQFSKDACGTDKCFHILALISPDQSYNDKYPLLVGTNALRPMIRDCQKRGGIKFLDSLPIQANWAIAYIECCKVTDYQTKDAKVLSVTLSSKVPVRLKHGELCTLKGICHTKSDGGFQALVGGAEEVPTPGGLIVYDLIVDVRSESHNKFKLAVKNVSQHDITLYPKTVIAECFPIDWAVPVLPSDQNVWSDIPQPQARSLFVSHYEKNNSAANALHLDFGESPISPQLKEHLEARVNKEVPSAFSRHDLDVGSVAGVTHRIELEDHVPFKERTRRVSPADFSDLKRHLQDLLAAGIIEETQSPYASPVVLVRKKNGELRMVVDYCRLNNLTRKDAYPLPRIEETFALLSGSKWFTVLDLKSGYYHL